MRTNYFKWSAIALEMKGDRASIVAVSRPEMEFRANRRKSIRNGLRE
ncbi:hypothetical protein [Leptolyngbya sp. NIES-2104]|nr:hypothetical protein [Leptolyngbya sp. NIES-2104]GAP95952.1 hypothetical protein NIES2104_24810 [Leptolyngbya sp. NIES-2104]